MPESLRFAHLSDIHLPTGIKDCAKISRLAGKRLFSALSWFGKRRHLHQKSVTDALAADIRAHKPDLVLITGDLINLALPAEYDRARRWLKSLGAPEHVMVIPGNHDLLVDEAASRRGLALYAPWFGEGANAEGADFPIMRQRKDVLFIGLSTAMQTPLGWCSGALGAAQLSRLEKVLKSAGSAGLCRIVSLHHPPAGRGKPRGGLEDADAFARLIAAHGAELIVHGHSHRASMNTLPGPNGPVPVIGVASASVTPGKGYPQASWHAYEICRNGTDWKIALDMRRYEAPDQPFALASQAMFRSP